MEFVTKKIGMDLYFTHPGIIFCSSRPCQYKILKTFCLKLIEQNTDINPTMVYNIFILSNRNYNQSFNFMLTLTEEWLWPRIVFVFYIKIIVTI